MCRWLSSKQGALRLVLKAHYIGSRAKQEVSRFGWSPAIGTCSPPRLSVADH